MILHRSHPFVIVFLASIPATNYVSGICSAAARNVLYVHMYMYVELPVRASPF